MSGYEGGQIHLKLFKVYVLRCHKPLQQFGINNSKRLSQRLGKAK